MRVVLEVTLTKKERYNVVLKMRKIIFVLFVLFAVTTAMEANRAKYYADASYDTNAKMKALYVYNFTKYIDWPEAYKQGNFIIGLLGETSIKGELDKVAATRKAVNQTIEIKQYASIADIGECHMLYVSKEKSAQFNAAVQKTKGKSTLVITEEDGFAKQGAGISFVIVNSRQKFELSKNNIQQRDMKVGSNLLSLAIVVD